MRAAFAVDFYKFNESILIPLLAVIPYTIAGRNINTHYAWIVTNLENSG